MSSQENLKYQKYVEEKSPKSPMFRSLLSAFIVGGIICCIGELIGDIALMIEPTLDVQDIGTWRTVVMIAIGGFLTAIGVYDKIGYFAGAGSIIPITGFANSIVSPAMEFNREGIVFGVCAKMFVIAGPILVFGLFASFVIGLIGLAM